MKKVTSIFLALTILISCFVTSGITALADDSIITGKGQGDFTWEVNLNTNTLTLSGTGSDFYDTDKRLEVMPGVFQTIFFHALSNEDWDKVEEYKDSIFHIVYNEGITEAGLRINYHLPYLKTVTFPKSLKNITDSLRGCDRLEKIYFKSTDTLFYQIPEIIPLNRDDKALPVIVAQKDSTAYDYAKHYGRTFCDASTNELTYFDGSNSAFMSILNSASGFKKSEPVNYSVSMSDAVTWQKSGYQPLVCHEFDTNNEYYVQIKNQALDIIKGCDTDYQKATAITKWVNTNIKYSYNDISWGNIGSLYKTYVYKSGNCEGFSLLTEYMLYFADIPTVHITGSGHAWSGALLDGEWYMIDYLKISKDFNSFYQIKYIGFYMDDVCYIIDDITGIKVAGVGTEYSEKYRKDLKSVTIADFATMAYKTAFDNCSKDFEVHVSKKQDIHSQEPWISVKTIFGDKKSLYYVDIADIPKQKYTGREVCPDVVLMDGDYVLVKDKDYTVKYENNIVKRYDAKIFIEGINDYSGNITKTFVITCGDQHENVYCVVEYPTYEKDGYKSVTCCRCHEVISFEILPKYEQESSAQDQTEESIKKPSKNVKLSRPNVSVKVFNKKIKVSYSKVARATGYQIRYKKNNKWTIKTYKSKKAATRTIKNLKKGKYQLQVRAYAIKNKEYSYSKWSKVKKFRIK